MQVAIILTREETLQYEEEFDHKIINAISLSMKNAGATMVFGDQDDGYRLYDICFEPCCHKETYIDDRMQEICRACNEDLGR